MAKFLALYLPQFHPVPENNEWWGPGFTEWRSVASAKPLFRGHVQPKIPKDLGFYDLRLEATRIEQAKMAEEYGIDGFCYWHYWFGNGKRLLNYPFDEVVKTGKPDFPFCLAWANHSWYNKAWGGEGKDKLLIEQQYLGKDDYILHFNTMLPAFKDKRYIRHRGKLLFMVFNPIDSPQMKDFLSTWRNLASENGLGDFYFVGCTHYGRDKSKIFEYGYDAIYNDNTFAIFSRVSNFMKFIMKLKNSIFRIPLVYSYKDAIKFMLTEEEKEENVIPVITSNWDHSPRSGKKLSIFINCEPRYFKSLVKRVCEIVSQKKNDLVIVKSWNEWGEGNYLEPDLEFGRGMLEALRDGRQESGQ